MPKLSKRRRTMKDNQRSRGPHKHLPLTEPQRNLVINTQSHRRCATPTTPETPTITAESKTKVSSRCRVCLESGHNISTCPHEARKTLVQLAESYHLKTRQLKVTIWNSSRQTVSGSSVCFDSLFWKCALNLSQSACQKLVNKRIVISEEMGLSLGFSRDLNRKNLVISQDEISIKECAPTRNVDELQKQLLLCLGLTAFCPVGECEGIFSAIPLEVAVWSLINQRNIQPIDEVLHFSFCIDGYKNARKLRKSAAMSSSETSTVAAYISCLTVPRGTVNSSANVAVVALCHYSCIDILRRWFLASVMSLRKMNDHVIEWHCVADGAEAQVLLGVAAHKSRCPSLHIQSCSSCIQLLNPPVPRSHSIYVTKEEVSSYSLNHHSFTMSEAQIESISIEIAAINCMKNQDSMMGALASRLYVESLHTPMNAAKALTKQLCRDLLGQSDELFDLVWINFGQLTSASWARECAESFRSSGKLSKSLAGKQTKWFFQLMPVVLKDLILSLDDPWQLFIVSKWFAILTCLRDLDLILRQPFLEDEHASLLSDLFIANPLPVSEEIDANNDYCFPAAAKFRNKTAGVLIQRAKKSANLACHLIKAFSPTLPITGMLADFLQVSAIHLASVYCEWGIGLPGMQGFERKNSFLKAQYAIHSNWSIIGSANSYKQVIEGSYNDLICCLISPGCFEGASKKTNKTYSPLEWPIRACDFLQTRPPKWIESQLGRHILTTSVILEDDPTASVRGQICSHFGPQWRPLRSTPSWVQKLLRDFFNHRASIPNLPFTAPENRNQGSPATPFVPPKLRAAQRCSVCQQIRKGHICTNRTSQ